MDKKKDKIAEKCSDITSVEKMFAANLCYHKTCFRRYMTLDKSEKNSLERESEKKFNALTHVLKTLIPYFKEGYGFTVHTIKEMMYLEDKSLTTIYIISM